MEKHPELLDGEVFLTNATEASYNSFDWKTKRMGVIAYDNKGLSVQSLGLRPCFIRREEVEKEIALSENAEQRENLRRLLT